MFWHYSKEGKRGVRAWWHFPKRRVLGVECYWWSTHCHVLIRVDDDGWTWGVALPPFALWISFDGFPAWKPQVKHVAAWDGGREFWLTDQRECGITIHDWTVWVKPWVRSMEWRRDDPWWVRGLSLNLKDFVLGRWRYSCEQIGAPFEVSIPMPEGMYPAIFQRQRQTWKRPRWFTHQRESYDVRIPKGIPFAGKGENSWDCGDDGLFGMGAEGSLQDAIHAVRATVLERRQRYGSPSDKAIHEALA